MTEDRFTLASGASIYPPPASIFDVNYEKSSAVRVGEDNPFDFKALDLVEPDNANASRDVHGVYLPPLEFRGIKDPSKEKIETPVDDRGLIDDIALIRAVKSTVTPGYAWPGQTDRHHKYWPRCAREPYRDDARQDMTFHNFRELGVNIISVPRTFHSWVHAVTIPPPMPEHEVMVQSLEAWIIVQSFFRSVRRTTEHIRIFEREERRRGGFTPPQTVALQDILGKNLQGVLKHLDALENIPHEYWPFSKDMKLQIAAGRVGQVLVKGWQGRVRAVRLEGAA